MKKNKKIYICILVIILLSFLVILINKNTKKEQKSILKEVKGVKKLDFCRSAECNFDSPVYFHHIYVESDDEQLKVLVDKINSKKEHYYKLMKNSAENNKCKDKYIYSIYVDSQTSTMEDDLYFSAIVNRKIYYVCENKSESIEPDVLNYDIVNHKEITQEELKKIANVTDDDIDEAITKELKLLPPSKTQYNINDITYKKLFIDKKKNVRIIFYVPQLDEYKYATAVQVS